MDFALVRTLRTPSSERYLLQAPPGDEFAVVDLHFLENHSVSGTLILLDDRYASAENIVQILSKLDEVLLPMAHLDNNLSFTVVVGRVLGAFEPDARRVGQ